MLSAKVIYLLDATAHHISRGKSYNPEVVRSAKARAPCCLYELLFEKNMHELPVALELQRSHVYSRKDVERSSRPDCAEVLVFLEQLHGRLYDSFYLLYHLANCFLMLHSILHRTSYRILSGRVCGQPHSA